MSMACLIMGVFIPRHPLCNELILMPIGLVALIHADLQLVGVCVSVHLQSLGNGKSKQLFLNLQPKRSTVQCHQLAVKSYGYIVFFGNFVFSSPIAHCFILTTLVLFRQPQILSFMNGQTTLKLNVTSFVSMCPSELFIFLMYPPRISWLQSCQCRSGLTF